MAAESYQNDMEPAIQKIMRDARSERVEGFAGRRRPMRVLCLGLGRTGTTSPALNQALKQLGYKPYDFEDRFMHDHLDLWNAATRAKFLNQGTPWGREELDFVTGDFDAVLDIPCCFFIDEFITAYPDAKVILNYRKDANAWLASMQKTLFAVFAWPSWQVLQYTEPQFCGKWFKLVNLIMNVFCDFDSGELCKQRYLEHNERVRNAVPEERLLEYEVKEGWDPLCKFLGEKRPEVEFPKGNGVEEFMRIHMIVWRISMWKSFVRVSKWSLSAASVAGIAWAWRRWM